jgi:hypothetical protein
MQSTASTRVHSFMWQIHFSEHSWSYIVLSQGTQGNKASTLIFYFHIFKWKHISERHYHGYLIKIINKYSTLKNVRGQVCWLMSVMIATQKIRRITVWGQPRQRVLKTSSEQIKAVYDGIHLSSQLHGKRK